MTSQPDSASLDHLIAQYVITNPQATVVDTAQALDVEVADVEQTRFWRRLRLSRAARELSPVSPLLGSLDTDSSVYSG